MPPERLRLLVADDEELARALVRDYAAAGDADVVAEATTGDELAAALAATRHDVMLVDIRMPGRDVFDVLTGAAAAAPLPAVVFATAYEAYAVRAFELNAVDYLIKPFSQERFCEALTRARRHRASRAPDAGLTRALRDLGPRPDRLLVPDGRRLVPVALADILWIEAEGDFARIHTPARSHLISRSLKELEQRLDPAHFIRVHRSAIVHASHIREVRPQGSRRYRVVLSDGTAVIVSRLRAPGLDRWTLR